LRVVFFRTRNFAIITFTDTNMYATSMAECDGYKLWGDVRKNIITDRFSTKTVISARI